MEGDPTSLRSTQGAARLLPTRRLVLLVQQVFERRLVLFVLLFPAYNHLRRLGRSDPLPCQRLDRFDRAKLF
jgi:hypothetical protein